MLSLNVEQLTTEHLQGYDAMMLECVMKVERLSKLADAVWSAVLKELDRRGKVQLHSGSYDDVGNALISRSD